MSRDIAKPSNFVSGSSMAYHYLAKFGDHRYCTSRDMFLVCHVIKQEHVIKELGDYNDRCSFKVSQHPTKFVGYRHCGIGDIMFLV